MPSKSEIDFCEMWAACGVGSDAPSLRIAAWVIPRRNIPGVGCGNWELAGWLRRDTLDEPWHITGVGADLVASFEAAIEQELEVKPDDAPEPAFKAGDLVRVRPECRNRFFRDTPAQAGDVLTVRGPNHNSWSIGPGPNDYARTHELQLVVCVPCPDCEFGRVSIPGLMSIAPVDPDHEVAQTMRCPTCKGEKVVETEAILDIGSSITGTGEILDGLRAAWIKGTGAAPAIGVIDDGWRQLTRAEGQRLAGKPFEARRGVDDPPRHHVASSAQPDAFAGFLRLVGGGNMRFDGTWWVRDAVADHG